MKPKVVLVTGGRGSIGRATATLFARMGFAAYAMSKRSVESFTEALRGEVGRFGISAICIQPGGTAGGFAKVEQVLYFRGSPRGPYADLNRRVLRMLGNNPFELRPEQVAR